MTADAATTVIGAILEANTSAAHKALNETFLYGHAILHDRHIVTRGGDGEAAVYVVGSDCPHCGWFVSELLVPAGPGQNDFDPTTRMRNTT